MKQLDTLLETYLVHKAPALPPKWKEVLVKFLPWIVLIVLILALPGVLILLGISAFVLPTSALMIPDAAGGISLAVIFLIATIILDALAVPGLFKRSKSAWNLLFYSTLLSAVHSLISFNLGGLIIGTLISLYLLYQIKSYYK